MPDETRGVSLWYGERNLFYHPTELFADGREATHRALPVDEAAAVDDVLEMARRTLTCRQGVPAEVAQAQRDLMDAYFRLDAIRSTP